MVGRTKAAVSEILQAVEINGHRYEIPETLAGLADAINNQTDLVDKTEGTAQGLLAQAFEHSVIAGHLLVEARRRVKTEKKKGDAGWLKWLETNFVGGTTSAHRYISLAEYFPHVENATSRAEALRIIDGLKKAALESGESNAPVRGRPRKQISAPNTEEVAPPAAVSINGNGHTEGDGREEYRAALSGEVTAINEISTAAPTQHVVTVSPAPFVDEVADDEEEAGPSDDDLEGVDDETAEILEEFESGAPATAEAQVIEVDDVVIVVPEGPSTMRFQFTGSPQQVELKSFQATLDRFEVELGPVTLNRAFDVDLKSLTVLITDIQCKLADLMERIIKVSEDRKIRTELKSARQEGLV